MTGATIYKMDKRYISLTLDTTLHPQATSIINNILENLEDIKAAKEAKAEGGELKVESVLVLNNYWMTCKAVEYLHQKQLIL